MLKICFRMAVLLSWGLAASGCDAVPSYLFETFKIAAKTQVEQAVQNAVEDVFENALSEALGGELFPISDLDLDLFTNPEQDR